MRAQRGQAILIMTMVLLVLLGIVALGVDAGRGFADRRQLQAASDAAALAAAADYHLHGATNAAAARGSQLFAANIRAASLSGAPAASCDGVSDDGATNFTVGSYRACIGWKRLSSTDASQVRFDVVASHLLPVALMQVLGAGTNMRIAADASAVTGYAGAQAAVIALAPEGCPPDHSGDAIVLGGNSDVTVYGAVLSNGTVALKGGSTPTINGDLTAACGPAPTGVTVTGAEQVPGPPTPDPAYPLPDGYRTGASQSAGTAVDLHPGVYPNLSVSAGCYFAWPGVYTLSGGYRNTGALVSNELRAPGEPDPTNVTKPAPTPLWGAGGAGCAGLVRLAAASTAASKKLPAGDWAVRVTAVRRDANAARESAGSRVSGGETQLDETRATCTAVHLDGSQAQGLQAWIDNAPGAQSYNVYLASGGCGSASFGYVGSVAQTAAEVNRGSCPEAPNPAPGGGGGWQAPKNPKCGLGFVITPTYTSSDWTGPTGVRCPTIGLPTAPAVKGCAPPVEERVDQDGGTTMPPMSGAAAPPGDLTAGDRANENLCTSASGTPTPCTQDPSLVTPGGVSWVLEDGTCFDQAGNGGTYLFGGQQYRWLVLYQVGACTSETFNGGAIIKLIGTVYLPHGDVKMNGSLETPILGALIANTITMTGASGVVVRVDTSKMPGPRPPRLVT